MVGINASNIKRRELLGNQSDEFIITLKNHIVAYIDKNYRTNDMRMYFGWEMAGGIGLELFAKQPILFNAYFLASSTYFNQELVPNLQKRIAQVLKQ